jgi:rubredoxin
MALLCCTGYHQTEVSLMGMECYTCRICGHTYNPEKGEPLQNIRPGIAFPDLPDDWSCPVCSAEKTKFTSE